MKTAKFRIVAVIVFAVMLILGYAIATNSDNKPATQHSNPDYSIH